MLHHNDKSLNKCRNLNHALSAPDESIVGQTAVTSGNQVSSTTIFVAKHYISRYIDACCIYNWNIYCCLVIYNISNAILRWVTGYEINFCMLLVTYICNSLL